MITVDADEVTPNTEYTCNITGRIPTFTGVQLGELSVHNQGANLCGGVGVGVWVWGCGGGRGVIKLDAQWFEALVGSRCQVGRSLGTRQGYKHVGGCRARVAICGVNSERGRYLYI